jgi:hypothetical protein
MASKIMRVRTVFTYGAGSPGLMTHYFSNGTGVDFSPSEADAQVAVDRVRDMMLTSPTIWPTSFTWGVSGEVDVLLDTTGEVQDQLGVTARSGAGTNTFPLGPLPVGLLLVASTNAFVSGRRLRGRTYFVPVNAGSVTTAAPTAGTKEAVVACGNALLAEGTTGIFPVVWSRPRPATAVGPHRPAGPARAARVGSSARAVSYSTPSKFVVLTSRRD